MSCLSRITIGTGKTKETEVCVRKIPWRRKWQPTSVLLSENSHGRRSLTGYSPWGCRVRHDWTLLCVARVSVLVKRGVAGFPNGCSYKERPWDHKFAADRRCSEDDWWCSWVLVYLKESSGPQWCRDLSDTGLSMVTWLSFCLPVRASLVAQTVKRLPILRDTWVQSLGREDPLEKAVAPHSSVLAWKIPWTEEPGRLQSWGHKESDTTERLHHDYSMLFSTCHCSLCPVFKNFRLSLFLHVHYYLIASCSQHVPLFTGWLKRHKIFVLLGSWWGVGVDVTL